MAASKMWGKNPFWGVDCDMDPEWMLTEEHKEFQRQVMEVCRTTVRPNAIKSDETYEFPRNSLDALGDIGVLSMAIPKEFGGLGLNHVGIAMVVESIARYGCASTAMVLAMHLVAVDMLLLRYHENPALKELMIRIRPEKLVGTLAYSDPASGGHFWYALSSKIKQIAKDKFQVLKVGSWCTSAGFADFYVLETAATVGHEGDYSAVTDWIVFKDEIRANSDDWQSLGVRGNQSGPITFEGSLTSDRVVGKFGNAAETWQESTPLFLMMTSACWCGLSMGLLDTAKRHVTNKYHADVGRRVCDYPTIQDYFGDSACSISPVRVLLYGLCQAMDEISNNNDHSKKYDPKCTVREKFVKFVWQLRYQSAKVVCEVGDTMLHACGGDGFKSATGLERLLRDSKAGWLLAPSNEYLRQLIGKTVLIGDAGIDFWDQKVDKRRVEMETRKMTLDEKEALARQLLREVDVGRSNYSGENEYQGNEFDNPFSTDPPRPLGVTKTSDGVQHNPALNARDFVTLKLKEWKYVADSVAMFHFDLPSATDHLGCMPGQFIQVQVQTNGKKNLRFYSPTSAPTKYGVLELVTRFERQGIVSQHLKALKPGDTIEARGPCGGYEYVPNTLQHLTLISSGVGCTPALQLVRSILADPDDATPVSMVHFAEKPSDIFFKEEFEKFAKGNTRFNILFTVKDGDGQWAGPEGGITQEVLQANLPSGGSVTTHKVLLCGGPMMTSSVLEYLKELGYSSDQLFIYGQFGVEFIRKVFGRKTKLSTHKSDTQ